MTASARVEIAVEDIAGLEIAARGGAHRVELCADLDRGGVTPSLALVEEAAATAARLIAEQRAHPGFDVHVLIRPVASTGDFLGMPPEFVVTADEAHAMARSAADVITAGAAGVVLGALHPDGTIDVDAVAAMRDAALGAGTESLRPVHLTFHRALDAMPDRAHRVAAMEQLLALGFHRALSSGGAARAIDGADDLAAMVRAADGLVDVCAGGGVRPASIRALIDSAGVQDVHLSARSDATRGLPTRTDPAVVQAAVDAAGEQ